jgi:hypothetical protein
MSDYDNHSGHCAISRFRKVLLDTRGGVLLEYSILVGTVALACAVGLLVVGVAVLNSFGFVRELLLSAIP